MTGQPLAQWAAAVGLVAAALTWWTRRQVRRTRARAAALAADAARLGSLLTALAEAAEQVAARDHGEDDDGLAGAAVHR